MLTNRRQQQAIADLVHGLTPDINAEEMQDPFDFLWNIVVNRPPQEAYQQLLRVKISEPELIEVIDEILTLEPGYKAQHRSLAEIGPLLPKTTWFWPEWIPRGLLTLLAAWPGVGKTYLALDLAHRVISDANAPDGTHFELRTGQVIYVDAEDFLSDIYERAGVWGMDMSKFFPIQRPPRDLIDMSQPMYQDPLIDMCSDIQPDLVIVDSLSSVNSRGENNIEDLRDVLGFFIELARAFDVALLLIHHLRKPGKGATQPVTMHDLRGTGHLVAMARSILGVDIIKTGPEEDLNGPRQLKVLKKNRGKYPKPLSIQYQPSAAHPDVAVLSYGPIEMFERYPETLAEKCATWLVNLLEERGPLPYSEIQHYAAEEDFKRGVLADARQLLGNKVVDTRGPKRIGNKWAVAGQPLDEFELASDSNQFADKAPPLIDQCSAWLLTTLEAGPQSYSELRKKARQVGFKENLLQKARKRYPQIVDTVGPRRKGNQWKLAE